MKTLTDYLEELPKQTGADEYITGKLYKPKLTVDEVDPKELARGIEIELEHTPDKKTATVIALHHLAEDDKYYTRHFKPGEH
jgi:hypothetical protein